MKKDKRQMNNPFRQSSNSQFHSQPKFKRETSTMIRSTLIAIAILGSAATAIASVNTTDHSLPRFLSIFAVNETPAMIDGVIIEKCEKEDCSDTPSNS
jgi:hypothetical protein